MERTLNIDEIKKLYPDEWILLGNPVWDEANLVVLSGIPLYHSRDKKEVCYLGRDKTAGYDKISMIYTGVFKSIRKITGIFNQVKQ